MADKWITFAFLKPHWCIPKELPLPFRFSEKVSLQVIPEWIRIEDSADVLRPKLKESMDDEATHCIVVEYEADALGAPDPSSKGAQPRPIQDSATELLRFAMLTLWLVRPTAFTFDMVAHAVKRDSYWVTRQVVDYDRLCALPEYQADELSLEDFSTAESLFRVLSCHSSPGTIFTALQTTARALTEQGWTFRFLLLWITVESLFGPEDAREITFRLSQRAALFLETGAEQRKALFAEVKDGYGWRSKVVHGLRLRRLTAEQSQKLLTNLEKLVRRSLTAILSDKTTALTFDGGEREDFLDGLPFR